MVYLQRSSEKRKGKKKKLIISLVIVFVLTLGMFFRDSSAGLVHKLLYPVNRVVDVVLYPFENMGAYFSSKVELERSVEELSEENKRLKIEILSMNSIKNDNEELRDILGVADILEDRIVSEIILTPPFSPFDTFVIKISDNLESDKGEVRQKITVGDSVFVRNILVGEVTEVYDSTAVVKLSSSYDEKIPVEVGDGIVAEANGQGGLSFTAQLPKDVEVELDSPVYSIEYPGTVIGFIDHIEKTESSSFQTLYFQYPFGFSDFDFVEVEY